MLQRGACPLPGIRCAPDIHIIVGIYNNCSIDVLKSQVWGGGVQRQYCDSTDCHRPLQFGSNGKRRVLFEDAPLLLLQIAESTRAQGFRRSGVNLEEVRGSFRSSDSVPAVGLVYGSQLCRSMLLFDILARKEPRHRGTTHGTGTLGHGSTLGCLSDGPVFDRPFLSTFDAIALKLHVAPPFIQIEMCFTAYSGVRAA